MASYLQEDDPLYALQSPFILISMEERIFPAHPQSIPQMIEYVP